MYNNNGKKTSTAKARRHRTVPCLSGGAIPYVHCNSLNDGYEKYEFSLRGKVLLKELEGFRSKRYKPDSSETNYTIGYGHLIQPTEEAEIPEIIDKNFAEDLLRDDLVRFENNLNEYLEELYNFGCHVNLTQYQYDALIICSFQKGENIWNKRDEETGKLLYDIPIFISYRKHFDNYDKVFVALVGSENLDDIYTENYEGLRNRRREEAELFVYQDYKKDF